MRISKSTKTSVKASTDKCSYAYWQEEIMDERLAGLDSDAKYEEYLKWKNNNCKDVEAYGVKASTISNTDISKMSTTELFNYIHDDMKESFAPEGNWIRKFCDISGISRDDADANYWHNTEIPNNPTANRKIIDYLKGIDACREVKASIDSDINRYKKSLEKKAAKSGVYENFGADEIRKLRDKYSVYQDDVTDYRTAQHNLNSLNSFEDWCANYVGATTANDKVLKHIKAAIDILGKSGDKSDVTKDSIANLATVLFDIQSGTDTKKK